MPVTRRPRGHVLVEKGPRVISTKPRAPDVVAATHGAGTPTTAVFFNHRQERCGVYQMGSRIGRALDAAGVATYVECPDHATASMTMRRLHPRVAVYNWHPATIPWAPELVRRHPACKHIGLMHEISPENPAAGAEVFPLRIVSDPSFPSTLGVFATIRHIPRSDPPPPPNARFTVGSFGFAVGGKMFGEITTAVAKEFPGALVRLRVPSAHYGDDAGALARATAEGVRNTGADVELQIEHDFLTEPELIRWLQGNDLNVFFYDYNPGRGISSVLDYAIAARRPIAINGSQMFRHVDADLGTYPKYSLLQSLDALGSVKRLYETWSPDAMVQQYRAIIGHVLA